MESQINQNQTEVEQLPTEYTTRKFLFKKNTLRLLETMSSYYNFNTGLKQNESTAKMLEIIIEAYNKEVFLKEIIK